MCLGAALPLNAQTWQKVHEDQQNNIQVYKRETPQGYVEFRAQTEVSASLSACVALLRDVKVMPNWVDRTADARVLKWISDKEAYAWHVSKLGWPFRRRDAVIHSVLQQDSDSLEILIRGSAIAEYPGTLPEEIRRKSRKYVRMPVVESSWRFSPLPEGKVAVSFQGYGDPGGNTSSAFFRWLIGKLAWESPYKTLKNFQEYVQKEKYQQAKLEFIQNREAP